MADEPTEPESEPSADTVSSDDSNADEAISSEMPEKSTATDEAAVPTVKRKVVSKRVTPKGGGPVQPTGRATKSPSGATKGSTAAHAHSADGHDADYSSRYTPPTAKYAAGPSPWWVPALMFGLLILGALIIMLNYMGVFGDADNVRLIIGLAFILGGIITATQLR